MKIEIIATGDEIISGNVVNTNTSWISDKLWMNGFEVGYHTAIRDDKKTIEEALRIAAGRAKIVIVTGGLGPTEDDFTLEVAASVFGKKLTLDKKYLTHLKRLFSSWGREMRANNEKQAYIPKESVTYLNKVGTAPGVGATWKKTRFYFLPGVPREMKQLFDDFILPEIIQNRKEKIHFESKMLRCFGAAESQLDDALKDLYTKKMDIQNVRIGFRAHFPDTLIKLSAWGKNKKEAEKNLFPVEEKIRERINKYIYGVGDTNLETIVGELLTKHKKTLATAESCTGGLIANRITNIPGSSAYFLNGLVTYSNESKIKFLNIPKEILEKFGAVSSECAIAMAENVRKISGSDFGLAVTGIAGPNGGTKEKPVGTVHLALSSQSGTREKKYIFPRNRDWFKNLVSSLGLDWIRRELL